MGKKIIVENRMAHQIKAILLRLFLARSWRVKMRQQEQFPKPIRSFDDILRPEINAITFWF
jgi:hypothetical protein